MCDFQKLAFSEHGYIVRCNDCNHYQVGFGTTMLTLSQTDFNSLIELVEEKKLLVAEDESIMHEGIKSVVIPTPFSGMCLIVTKNELQYLSKMLTNADNETKALSLLELFK